MGIDKDTLFRILIEKIVIFHFAASRQMQMILSE